MAFSWRIKDDIFCAELPPWSVPDDICFPGGACVSKIISEIQTIPAPSEIVLDYLSQLGPAMSFLSPFFQQLDTVIAIFNCIEAFVDFSTSLNPKGVIECVPDLIEKVTTMLNMIPQLALPRLIITLVKTIADFLRFLAADLEYIQTKLTELADGIDAAADMGDVNLGELLACSQDNIEQQLLTTADALKGIGRIILLINIFLGLIGGPEIPCFGSLLSDADALDPVIELLRDIASLLDELAGLIPDPQIAITRALGEQRC